MTYRRDRVLYDDFPKHVFGHARLVDALTSSSLDRREWAIQELEALRRQALDRIRTSGGLMDDHAFASWAYTVICNERELLLTEQLWTHRAA
jgi:hypothetical protein